MTKSPGSNLYKMWQKKKRSLTDNIESGVTWKKKNKKTTRLGDWGIIENTNIYKEPDHS